ncbi:MAG: radical SAM protein [Planctomycetes bacterium]|nr:radical SAM protein [Planctomycetota bacterium]
MRTLLLFPPQAHPTQPYLCLPSLVAFLRANGFPDTHQRDLNLEAHEWFLRKERLALARDRVAAAFAVHPTDAPLPLPEMDRFRVLAEAHASADAVVEGIDQALHVLRHEEAFYDYDRYLRAVKLLDRAFRLISAEHYPTALTPHNYTLPHSIEKEAEVLAAVFDEPANFFCEYYRAKALPEIVAAKPDLVGISLTYTSQVIPGLALARMIKEALPNVHVTVGGGLLAYIGEKATKSGKVFAAIDSAIVLEGEGPLLELAKNVAAGKAKPAEGVGNAIWKDGEKVVVNAPASPLSIDSLPTPEFDGLPMERYYSPKLALPLAITRGCYWEKCAFCTLYKVIGPGFRQRRLDKVMDDIEKVTARWKSDVIYFVVEDMPPPVFKQLPVELAKRRLDIKWWTDARLEKNLFTDELCKALYESGCRRIAFGFESASQRLLDLMEKGTAISEAEGILRRLAKAGISNTLYTMIGFPTETREEAQATLEWLRTHKECVDEVSLRIFYVDHLSKVFEHPEAYGVERILIDPEKDLQVYYDWIPARVGTTLPVVRVQGQADGPDHGHPEPAGHADGGHAHGDPAHADHAGHGGGCGAATTQVIDGGMSRREARELFFDFMKVLREEFPLFRGDNLLLFELKSHYFLYLCKYGDLSFLAGKSEVAVAEAAPADFAAARLRLPDGNRLVEMPYDLRTIAEKLNEAECAVLKPRYQSGNFKEKLFEEMAAQVPAAPPAKNFAVYRARSSDLLHVGKDAARLLAACDGSRATEEIVAGFAPAQQEKVRRFLGELLARGLLTAAARGGSAARGGDRADGAATGGRPEARDFAVAAGPEERVRVAEALHLHCKPSGI